MLICKHRHRSASLPRLVPPPWLWYDCSMTSFAKIAITLPREQLARAKIAVKAGRAASVSGYISSTLEQHAADEALQALVADLIAQHGEPSTKDRAWAKRVLKRRKRR